MELLGITAFKPEWAPNRCTAQAAAAASKEQKLAFKFFKQIFESLIFA
jgi:hypothetical protein